jgi:hypothetical protein
VRCGPRHGTWRPAMGGEHWPRLAGAGAAAACATNAECSRASCKTVTVWHDRTPTRFRPAGDDASVRSHDFPPPSSHRVPITYIMSGRVMRFHLPLNGSHLSGKAKECHHRSLDLDDLLRCQPT